MQSSWQGTDRRAIAILRVSSRRQKDNTSHEVQGAEIDRYALEHELTITRQFAIVESAKDADARKLYHGAIAWALKQKIQHVLFYMTDREGRNFTDIETNQKLIKQGRLVVHYVRDRRVLHRESPHTDFMMRQFQAFQDKQLSEIISSKVNDAMRHKAESGWLPANHAPLGYVHQHPKGEDGREKKRGTTIVVDPDERNVRWVQREFELRAAGQSLAQIRAQVIAEGLVPAKRIKTYSLSCLDYRLRNPFYRGRFNWQGIEYEGKHELIVPRADLDAVDRTYGLGRRTPRQVRGIFGGGWMRCADAACGCQVVYDPKVKLIKETGESREFRYYHCSNGRAVHASMRGMNVREESLWNQFGAAVDCISITDDRAREIARVMNRAHAKVSAAVHREIEGYSAALNEIDVRRDRLVDLLVAHTVGDEEYRRQLERLRTERVRLTGLLEHAQHAINGAYLKTARYILELATEAKSLWIERSPAERKELLDEILSNPVLDGPIVRYDLKKPFAVLAQIAKNESGGPNWNYSKPALVAEFRSAVLALVG